MPDEKSGEQTVPSPPSTTTFRKSNAESGQARTDLTGSTTLRKNFKDINSFIAEPDSRQQVSALEENVKAFGVTYFGMSDKRQGESGE
jgi:hypothetical protein